MELQVMDHGTPGDGWWMVMVFVEQRSVVAEWVNRETYI